MIERLIDFLFDKRVKDEVSVVTVKSNNRNLEHFFHARQNLNKRKKVVATSLSKYFSGLDGLNFEGRNAVEAKENAIVMSL